MEFREEIKKRLPDGELVRVHLSNYVTIYNRKGGITNRGKYLNKLTFGSRDLDRLPHENLGDYFSRQRKERVFTLTKAVAYTDGNYTDAVFQQKMTDIVNEAWRAANDE